MFAELENIAVSWINLFKSTVKLIKLEAKLAKMAIKPILLISFLVLLTIVSLWFSAIALISVWLYTITQNIILTLGIIIAIHILLLIIFAILLNVYYQQLQFKQTRALLQRKRDSHAKTTPQTTD